MDTQPHWVSALTWPEESPGAAWAGETPELLLVGRIDGSLGLIEVLDISSMRRVELEHCYRKDGEWPWVAFWSSASSQRSESQSQEAAGGEGSPERLATVGDRRLS